MGPWTELRHNCNFYKLLSVRLFQVSSCLGVAVVSFSSAGELNLQHHACEASDLPLSYHSSPETTF